MIAVADATPLHYLVIIGHSGVLPQIFKSITIPPAVAAELRRPKTPDVVRSWISRSPAWLDIRLAPESETADLERLGAGEREAILLAEEIGADWLIIDDHHGRLAAARHGVPVIGTLRVLDEAAARSLIDLSEAIKGLQETTFYVAPDLFRWLIDRDAERRKNK